MLPLTLKKYRIHLLTLSQNFNLNMLTAKYILEAASAEEDGYLHLKLCDKSKQVEIDDEMTLFVAFSRNQSSLWNVMTRQADELFEFSEQVGSETDGGIERTYVIPNNPYGFILCNNYIQGHICAQLTIPISERALDRFMVWETSPAGCCKFFADMLQLSLAERSQDQYYVAGGLLANK